MKTGKVMWYNSIKCYGFIRSDNEGYEIFMRGAVLQGEGELHVGRSVMYLAEDGNKGLVATKVELL